MCYNPILTLDNSTFQFFPKLPQLNFDKNFIYWFIKISTLELLLLQFLKLGGRKQPPLETITVLRSPYTAPRMTTNFSL